MALRWAVAGTACVLLAMASGCSAPERRADFRSIDPSERSAAAAKAASDGDRAAVADLIGMLDSSDPAARMVAIAALERITGERLGYDATAERPARNEAVERWVEYAREHGLAEGSGVRGG